MILRLVAASALAACALAIAACSSSSNATATDAGPGGGPVTGAQDTHCKGQTPQPVHAASCHVTDAGAPADTGVADAAADAGNGSGFGDTMYGASGDDDDCKYHLQWSITPTHVGQPATITVSITTLADGKPVTGDTPHVEYFDDTQDTETTSASETSPGTYTIAPITFDKAEQWQIRFHIHEECADLLDDSPHGHAAFYLSVNP
jgi:hypothetical protein